VKDPQSNPVFLLFGGKPMDLIKDKPSRLYGRFLTASFGSALISSLYSVVDMACVGQYGGSSASAAMAVVAPMWNIIYSLGLWVGMGGAVLYSKLKGETDKKDDPNSFFTLSLILCAILSLLAWVLLFFFEEPVLRLFGATDALLPLAENYLYSIRFTVPIFLFNQVLAAFLRNDDDPALATGAIVFGGLFNVAGDYLLVFTANMGMEGAGIATVACNAVSLLVMLAHFFKKKNTLRLVPIKNWASKSGSLLISGFPSFFTDAAMGIITIVFNSQINRYFDEDTLAVYGVIININTFVQCCAYGVGQGVQPLLSINYGAKEGDRLKKFLRYGLITILIITAIWYSAVMIAPNGFINLFMKSNEHVLAIAPSIIRSYATGFIFLPFNVFSTYVFLSLVKPISSFIVSALRGLLLSLPLLLLLPLINPSLLFWAMPLSEILTFIYAGITMILSIKKMPSQKSVTPAKAH
jgi:putative MATE family efflux protein